MFERFTDRARRVLTLAQEEGRQLGHSVIGTEHLLLGLIDEDAGIAAKALKSLGISHEAVRQSVEEILTLEEIGERRQNAPTGSPPFTPRAKVVLELALRESLQLGHSYIGTEHILLGLVREGDGVAVQVLTGLGADPDRVREQVYREMSGYSVAGPFEGANPATRAPWCGQCRTELAQTARYRVIPVAKGDSAEEGDPIPIAMVYCRNCGTAMGAFKVDP